MLVAVGVGAALTGAALTAALISCGRRWGGLGWVKLSGLLVSMLHRFLEADRCLICFEVYLMFTYHITFV